MLKMLTARILATAIAICAGGYASAGSFDYTFDIRLGLIKIGEMHVRGSEDPSRYESEGRLRTSGLVGALYDLDYAYTSEGSVLNHWQLVPEAYSSTTHEGSKDRAIKITYAGNKVAQIRRSPAKPVKPRQLAQTDTIDPMTLIYMLLRPVSPEHVCGGTFVLFDGQSRLDVRYVDPHRYSDGRVVCGIDYTGGDHTRRVALSGLTFAPGDDGMLKIANFTVQTSAGSLKATRR